MKILYTGVMQIEFVEFVVFSDIDLEFSVQFEQAYFLDLKSKLQRWHEVYIESLLTSNKCTRL